MTLDINIKDTENNLKPMIEKKRENTIPKREKVKMSPEKKQKLLKIALIAILSIFLCIGAFYFYKGYILTKNMGLKISAENLFPDNKKPELKKDSTGKYTNALIVGIDTRENSKLLNTDTIVLLSYNYDTNEMLMLSIPRDFHVEINDTNWYSRINSVYSNAEQLRENTGLKELSKTVEEITNQEIQYYAMVDYNAFLEIIDTVGGITVNVENSFTDYMYPSGIGYQTVSFQAGPQEMDGETALKYSRSRHSMDNGEGSDYARARRQQKVIAAIQEKIISSETFTNPKTLMNIISSLANNIKVSEFTIDDIEAGLKLALKFKNENGQINSFVLDPTIGNNSLVETKVLESGAYAIGPVLGFGIYDDIHSYMDLLIKDPLLYKENARILVYNTGLGHQEAYQKTLELQTKYPYLNIVFAGTLYSDKQGIDIYTQNEEEPKNHTVEILSDYLKADTKTKPEYVTTNLNGEDVTILLGTQIIKENNNSEI